MKRRASIILLFFLTIFPGPFRAGANPPVKGRITVDGLSCPFCAFGMEKKLKAVSWISDIEIYVDDGYADFIITDGEKMDTKVLSRAIKKGGFTPRGIDITAEGVLKKSGPDVLLEVGPAFSLKLDRNDTRDRLLKDLKDPDKSLRITGEAQTGKDGTRIRIKKYEIIP